jgi:PAS domain-containing protein
MFGQVDRSACLVGALDSTIASAEVLRLAVHEAVAGLSGLGGLVHLRGPETTRGLCLVASSGLPAAFTGRWQQVGLAATAAPAVAARTGRAAWCPLRDGPGTGMASVPLRAAQGEAFGALTVVTAAAGEPTAGQWDVLRAVAGWAAGLLALAEPPAVSRETPPGGPAAEGEAGLYRAFRAVEVGAWAWYITSGLLDLDERSLALLGVGQDVYDGRIETWLGLVHPDDIAWVTTEVDKAVSTFGPYDAEYRVCRPDGTTRWVQARGRVEPDADGNPFRMLGTIWDTTESRCVRESVRSALRYMSDGFLSLDKDWRITFANFRAERLLGSPAQLTGRVLWDLLVIRRVPGLESRCRKAAAGGAPAGFDAEWPGTGRWYRFRFVPIPDGMAWYFTDITESRKRRAEQAAAERAAAERAARIRDLTAALAEAVTSRDVLCAVAERVLPAFGASGLTMQVVEGDRMRVLGAVGYPQRFVDVIGGPLSGVSPAADAMRNHQPWFISSPKEYAKRYPEFARQHQLIPTGKQSWAIRPLSAMSRARSAA